MIGFHFCCSVTPDLLLCRPVDIILFSPKKLEELLRSFQHDALSTSSALVFIWTDMFPSEEFLPNLVFFSHRRSNCRAKFKIVGG